jgi:hypothetical protein
LPFCHGGPVFVRQPVVIAPPYVARAPSAPTPLSSYPIGGDYRGNVPSSGGGGYGGNVPPSGGGGSGGSPPQTPTVAANPPASTPATPPVCTPPATLISIVFQPNATASDITSFLGSYGAQLGDGPDKDGIYRLRLDDTSLTQEQIQQVIESMRAQTTIVYNVGS